MSQQILFKREIVPIPGVKLSGAVQFHRTGNLTTGSGDIMYHDKTTKNWRRWAYVKNKKQIPDLCTNMYGNKLLIEKIEKAAMAIEERHLLVAETWFQSAMIETESQLKNPRSDCAHALGRLGTICMKLGDVPKAITCFEYSLHMRQMMFGKHSGHPEILQSLVSLGCAWSLHSNTHRAIIVLERALVVAKTFLHETKNTSYAAQAQVAEIFHNLGACWERLHEHHTALKCYEDANKIRQLVDTPEICVGANVKPHFLAHNLLY